MFSTGRTLSICVCQEYVKYDLESLAAELGEIRSKLCEEAIEKAKSVYENGILIKQYVQEGAANCLEIDLR